MPPTIDLLLLSICLNRIEPQDLKIATFDIPLRNPSFWRQLRIRPPTSNYQRFKRNALLRILKGPLKKGVTAMTPYH